MPFFSDHISNMYYSGGTPSYTSSTPSYSGSSYSNYSAPPLGFSYSASYLNPGGNYSNHSSISGYSRAPLSSRWSSGVRSYSPMLTTITERGTSSPVRITSPRRLPLSKRSYGTTTYTPRPININTADIDVSRDRYRSKASPPQAEPKPEVSGSSNDDSGPFMPRVDGKPETGIDSSPGHLRSTIKRGRTVVRLHTIKRKERDSPRKPNDLADENKETSTLSDDTEIQITSEQEPENTAVGWREKLSDDLIYKDKREKKTLGAKLVEKFILKEDDNTTTVKRHSKRIPKQDSTNLCAPEPSKKSASSKSPDRRCSMELLAEQANLLDSLIRSENLSTATLDLTKVGLDKSNAIKKQDLLKRSKSDDKVNHIQSTKSDHSLHERIKSLRDSRDKHFTKKRSLKKSSSGGSIRRLDSITEFPKESISTVLPAIEENRRSVKYEMTKPKLKQKITSTVDVDASLTTTPLKFRVENITVEEKTNSPQENISYTAVIDEVPFQESSVESEANKSNSKNSKRRKIKSLEQVNVVKPDVDDPSTEPDCDNFWDKIGKRETVYLMKRKEMLDDQIQKNRRALFWYPEENESGTEDKDVFADSSDKKMFSEDFQKSLTDDAIVSKHTNINSTTGGERNLIQQLSINTNKSEENNVAKVKDTVDNNVRCKEKNQKQNIFDIAVQNKMPIQEIVVQQHEQPSHCLTQYLNKTSNKTIIQNDNKIESAKKLAEQVLKSQNSSETTDEANMATGERGNKLKKQKSGAEPTPRKIIKTQVDEKEKTEASVQIFNKIIPKKKFSPQSKSNVAAECKQSDSSQKATETENSTECPTCVKKDNKEDLAIANVIALDKIQTCSQIDVKVNNTIEDTVIDVQNSSKKDMNKERISDIIKEKIHDEQLCSKTNVMNEPSICILKEINVDQPSSKKIDAKDETFVTAMVEKIKDVPIISKANENNKQFLITDKDKTGDALTCSITTLNNEETVKAVALERTKHSTSGIKTFNEDKTTTCVLPDKTINAPLNKSKEELENLTTKDKTCRKTKKDECISPLDSNKVKEEGSCSNIKKEESDVSTRKELTADVSVDSNKTIIEIPKIEDIPEIKAVEKDFIKLETNDITDTKTVQEEKQSSDKTLAKLLVSTAKKPVKDEPAVRPLIATPRPLQKKAPQVFHSSSSSDSTSDEDSSDDEDADESDTSEESGEFFECENNPDGRTSTGSNDSGFDSSAPTSPAGFVQIKKDCDVNCHRKCEKLTANLCGVNQRLLVEALASRTSSKRGGEAPSSGPSTGSPAPATSSSDVLEHELEASTAYGIFRKTGRFTPPARSIPRFRKYNVDDFHFIKVLGKGSFGKVLLTELRDTEYYYAVKCLKKDVVLEDDDVECTLIERKVLALGTNHPYLCHLFATFQTDSHLFFVMEYLNGGDLMFHIQQSGRFPEARARFYAAEIVSGLKFLHKRGIVYRDLKLDNILLDYEGHVRIADFGMCKLQIYLEKTADTFCGTPDYMAPEIIKGLKYNQTVDWWSFGVLLYEMLIGQSPFSGCDEDELFWSICNEMPSYPRFLSKESLSILTRLLDKDARTRLGGTECMHGDIRDQEFFHPVHWDKLERRELDAPFKPRVRHPLDTQYFDKAFTGERPRLTAVEPQVLRSMDQEPFRGFSYTNPNATDR